MSVAELKRAVDELSADERLELAAYLRHTSRFEDPSWQAEITRRLDASLSGKSHPSTELWALHQKLAGSNG